jgi:hypothetical protein
MFTIEQIESLFGQETKKYLQNKNRGGINGSNSQFRTGADFSFSA